MGVAVVEMEGGTTVAMMEAATAGIITMEGITITAGTITIQAWVSTASADFILAGGGGTVGTVGTVGTDWAWAMVSAPVITAAMEDMEGTVLVLEPLIIPLIIGIHP